jgi:hypothetical protein
MGAVRPLINHHSARSWSVRPARPSTLARVGMRCETRQSCLPSLSFSSRGGILSDRNGHGFRDVPERFRVAFSFAGEQRALVRSIAEALEKRLGLSTVFLDEWFEHYIAGDDGDLKLQRVYERQCELVIVCVSAQYGGKPWTQAEHRAIRARLMSAAESGLMNNRLGVLPLRVGDGEIEGIPFNTIAPDVRGRSPAETVELITARLRIISPGEIALPPSNSPTPHWPRDRLPFKHTLADRMEHEWPAVLRLLTAEAPKRVLLFKGPSGFSKSALLDAARRYAADVLRVPTAFVDFKDSELLSKANVVREVQEALALVLPIFATSRTPDRWELRQALRDFRGAALILFDVYERVAKTELGEWIETLLLPQAVECANLRFLIAGQDVPRFLEARWREQVEEIELKPIHDQRVWKEWIHERNPDVDEKHVQGIVLGCDGVPSTISQILETCAKRFTRAV